MSKKLCGLPKKVIRKYLYQFKVPLWHSDLVKLVNICATPNYDVNTFPSRYTPYALLQTKRALEECRKAEGIVSKSAVAAESNLIEAAADMGDKTAIALLCGARMSYKDVSKDDIESGGKLLKELMDSKFPLSFKVSADLAYTMGHVKEALKLYEMAIENGLEDKKLLVECYRNVGHLAFRLADLAKARKAFSYACQVGDNSKQVADCHYFLAQLRETDREATRNHLEMAASYGLHDSFLPLASLLLNVFNEPLLAKEWFKLAEVTDTSGSAIIGGFDCAMKLEDYKTATLNLAKIRRHANSVKLLELRRDAIARLGTSYTPPKTEYVKVSPSDKWNL